MEQFVTTTAVVGLVIVIASLLSGAVERSGVPLVAVFLALGAALGPYGLGLANVTVASPSLKTLATLALALVLFTDAVTLDPGELRRNRSLALWLLGPGTLTPAAVIALVAWWLLHVPALHAAMLGAALASTDPVILRSVLHSRSVPMTARAALRLESSANDVVLLPIIVIAMLLLRDGGSFAEGAGRELGRSLVGLFILGPALGAVVGWVGIAALVQVRSRLTVRRDYESLYALGLAFTGYAVAEAVGGSGFLAAFAAGVVVAMQDVELCDCFQEYGEATAEMLLLLTFVAFGTSLIWSGLSVLSWRTVVFAIVALVTRTLVLVPLLWRCRINRSNTRLIALLGPRGLSSLLLILLPVFAGVPGSEALLTVTCLVVLLSVLVHGTGIALFLRSQRAPLPPPAPMDEGAVVLPKASAPAPDPDTTAPATTENAERITLEELAALRARGEPVVLVDARADRSYDADAVTAAGAVRIHPEHVLEDARAQRLSQRATLVVYCA